MASYTHFKDEVLPRIKAQGYNCVQLMAVQVRRVLQPAVACFSSNPFVVGRTAACSCWRYR